MRIGMKKQCVLCGLGFLLLMMFFACPTWANEDDYSQQEKRLSQIPKYTFFDKRMKRVFQLMAKQYKHLYSHAASDGYILPDELRELKFQRQFMHRLYLVDKRHQLAKRELDKFEKTCRKKYAKERRIARRRKQIHKMKPVDEKQMTEIKQQFQRYEEMIRRFSCRHLADYKKRYNNTHCRRPS